MKCEICGEKLYYSQEENGLCWSCQQKIETGKCKICDETLTVLELYGNGMCWWCEKDEQEPDIWSGSSIGQNPGLSRQWLRVRVPSTPPLKIL